MARVMIAEDTDSIRLLLEDILSIVKHELVYQAKDFFLDTVFVVVFSI